MLFQVPTITIRSQPKQIEQRDFEILKSRASSAKIVTRANILVALLIVTVP